MLVLERREAIFKLVKKNHTITVAELSKQLFISETSARRDLNYLAQKGLVNRTYGGAVYPTDENKVMALRARQEELKAAKQIIAKKAITLVKPGDVLFLDSSSTSLTMGSMLPQDSAITVITNGARVALELVDKPGIKVYTIGGALMPNIYSYNGSFASEMTQKYYADKFFVSPKAVNMELGTYCASEDEAMVRKIMMQHSGETIMLCTAQKLGRRAPFFLCDFEAIDTFITNEPLSDEWESTLESHDIRII